jgi:hypothetical protein
LSEKLINKSINQAVKAFKRLADFKALFELTAAALA